MTLDPKKFGAAVHALTECRRKLFDLEQQLIKIVRKDMTGENMTQEEGAQIYPITQQMDEVRKATETIVKGAIYDRSNLEQQAAMMLIMHYIREQEQEAITEESRAKHDDPEVRLQRRIRSAIRVRSENALSSKYSPVAVDKIEAMFETAAARFAEGNTQLNDPEMANFYAAFWDNEELTEKFVALVTSRLK